MYIHKTPSLSFALSFFYQRLKKILRQIESLENFIVKKKKKLIWKSRPRTNIRISFLGEGFEAAVERQSRLSFPEPSSFYAPSQLPSLPSSLEPTRRSPTSRPRFFVESRSKRAQSVWWEDERGDRDPLAQIPHTLPLFLRLKYHKTGETRR